MVKHRTPVREGSKHDDTGDLDVEEAGEVEEEAREGKKEISGVIWGWRPAAPSVWSVRKLPLRALSDLALLPFPS